MTVQKQYNHEIWTVCPNCKQEFDNRLHDVCPDCKGKFCKVIAIRDYE